MKSLRSQLWIASRIYFAPWVLFFIVVFSSLLLLSGGVMAQESGTGTINAFAFAKNDGIVDKTGTNTTAVPKMTISFSGSDYALVRFCANGNMFGKGTGAIQVSAKLDNQQLGHEIQFFTSGDNAVVPRCFEWPAKIKPGKHTVTIFWRLTLGPGATLTGRFHDSVLTVLFRQ